MIQLRLAAAACLTVLTLTAAAADYRELINTRPASWQVDNWSNSEPLSLDDLKGRVVLIRWWTGPGCPFCRLSAKALEGWHEKYKAAGLTVIGFYHHKSASPFNEADVSALAKEMGFEFALAVDHDWTTLKRWWLDGDESRNYTSVSFLLDRDGVIRYIHPGGQYVEGDGDYEEMEAYIQKLLEEK